MEYNALSHPNSTPAIARITTFRPKITFHESIPLRSDKKIAIKSVPPVVSSAEIKAVLSVIKVADPHAFVNVMKTEQVAGRVYQKPNE